MPSIVKSFLGFDHLIGPGLVKLVYYFAAAIIVIMTGVGVAVGLFAIAGGNFGASCASSSCWRFWPTSAWATCAA
jgi:hypothetical protein